MSDIVHDPSTPQADNPEVRQAYSDVNLRGILVTAAVLLAVTVVICLVCWWMFDLFWSREAVAKRSQFPLAAAERGKLPRQPQLEGIKNTEGQPTYMRPRQLPAEEQEQNNFCVGAGFPASGSSFLEITNPFLFATTLSDHLH